MDIIIIYLTASHFCQRRQRERGGYSLFGIGIGLWLGGERVFIPMKQQLKRICIDDKRSFESTVNGIGLTVYSLHLQAAATPCTALQLLDTISKAQFSSSQQKGRVRVLHRRSTRSRSCMVYLAIFARKGIKS